MKCLGCHSVWFSCHIVWWLWRRSLIFWAVADHRTSLEVEPVSLSKCLSKPCYLTFIQISTTCHYSSLRRLYSSPPGSSKRSSECMPVSSFCLNKTPLYIPLFQTISIFYSASTVFTLAPKLWKSLHRPIRLTGPLILFKSLLKTQLYKLAFLKYFGHYSNNLNPMLGNIR